MEQDQNPHSPRPLARPWAGAVYVIMLAAMAAVLALLFRRLQLVGGLLGVAGNLQAMFGRPWRFPTAAALGLAVGGATVAGLFGVGYGLIAAIRPWRRMLPLAWERAALALPVAAVPVSLAVLGLGLAGWTGKGVYGALLGLMLAGGAWGWVKFAQDQRRGGWAALRRGLAAQNPLALAMLAALLGLALIYSVSPAIESDELRYHLSAPETWLRDGRIHYLHHQAFSNFPMLGEMLFMMAMGLAGPEGAKPIHLAWLPVCMALTALITRRLMQGGGFGRRRTGYGLAAGTAFAFIPAAAILAAWGWIDMFVTAYFLAFVYLTGRALKRPGRASGTLIGLAGAGGLSVKYTMLALMGGLGALWLPGLLLAGAGWRRILKLGGVVALTTAALSGAWYIRNAVWTGNPVYPGAPGIFKGGEWTQENQAFFVSKAGEKGMHLARPRGAAGQAVEFLISPVTTTFFDEKFEGHPLGALPLLAVIAAVGWLLAGGAGGRTFGRWIALALIVSWAAWFKTYQSNRFLLPTAALALALGGAATAGWKTVIPGRAWRWALRGIFVLAAAYAFMFTGFQMLATFRDRQTGEIDSRKVDAIATALGFKAPEDFLRQQLNYWRPAQWLARRVRPGEKTLLIGEHRTLHMPMPVVVSDWFDTPQPLPWIRQSRDNKEMLAQLRRAGVRYIFYNQAEIRRYWGYLLQRLRDPGERARFEDFLGQLDHNPELTQIYPGAAQEGIAIYEIRPKGGE